MTTNARRRRRYLLVALSAALTLQLFAVAAIYVGILRPMEQQRVRERRDALRTLDDPGLIVVPVPRDPIKLLIG